MSHLNYVDVMNVQTQCKITNDGAKNYEIIDTK